jgi:hypothetical protein
MPVQSPSRNRLDDLLDRARREDWLGDQAEPGASPPLPPGFSVSVLDGAAAGEKPGTLWRWRWWLLWGATAMILSITLSVPIWTRHQGRDAISAESPPPIPLFEARDGFPFDMP